jgi:hypothetical protein
MAPRRRGTVRAWQGKARRLHDGEGWRRATAMDGVTARRLHDGEGRSSIARDHGKGRHGGYTTARNGAAYGDGRRDGTKATRRRGTVKHGKGRRDGYTTARDGAALRRWTARRHKGYTTARDGAALRRWGAVTAPRRRGVCAPGK